MHGMYSIKCAVLLVTLHCCGLLPVLLVKAALCLQCMNAKINNGCSTAMTRVQDVAVDVSVVVECTCGVGLPWHCCT